jgi:hypothetical protein
MLKLPRSIVSVLPADSAVGRLWNSRTWPSVNSCTFFVTNGRVGSSCLLRPFALGLALPIVAALSRHDGVGEAGHHCPMAPSGYPSLLALAFEISTAFSGSRNSQADS